MTSEFGRTMMVMKSRTAANYAVPGELLVWPWRYIRSLTALMSDDGLPSGPTQGVEEVSALINLSGPSFSRSALMNESQLLRSFLTSNCARGHDQGERQRRQEEAGRTF